MKNIEFIIPAQTRTIYFNESKYRLNFPKIKAFGIYKKNYEVYDWSVFALNEKHELCKLPIPNVASDNIICFGYDNYGNHINPKNESEFKEHLFCTRFSNALTRTCSFNFNQNERDVITCEDIEEYFKNWQKNKKVKLIQVLPDEINLVKRRYYR